MRRFRDRQSGTLFRGGELPRLMAMVVMLAVLVMVMARAKDPHTWRWLSGDPGGDAQATAQPAAPNPPSTAGRLDPAATTSPADSADTPLDADADEIEAFQEECEAITDKAPMAAIEMPAYWRLMHWASGPSSESLRQRARADVLFSQLFTRPNKYRGQLMQLKLQLRRALPQKELPENPLGLKVVYEVLGWSSDSQPYSYFLICPELPPAMPTGASIYEEATFAGYFLKLMAYEDHEGKLRSAPVLIGRLIWHPDEQVAAGGSDESTWIWMVGGVLAALFVLRWGLTLWPRGRPARRAAALPRSQEGGAAEAAVETWLGRAEGNSAAVEINDASVHDINGNGPSMPPADRLDWTEDRER